jgi:hypothetical protein
VYFLGDRRTSQQLMRQLLGQPQKRGRRARMTGTTPEALLEVVTLDQALSLEKTSSASHASHTMFLMRGCGKATVLVAMADGEHRGEMPDRDAEEKRFWPCDRAPERARRAHPGNGGRRSRFCGSDEPAWPRRESR